MLSCNYFAAIFESRKDGTEDKTTGQAAMTLIVTRAQPDQL
jgi:hypothetical protein